MQFAKVAPPGFERETEIVVVRALTSVATEADLNILVLLNFSIDIFLVFNSIEILLLQIFDIR